MSNGFSKEKKHLYCPICEGAVNVKHVLPYDGYQGEIGHYDITCYFCNLSITDNDKECLINRWDYLHTLTNISKEVK